MNIYCYPYPARFMGACFQDCRCGGYPRLLWIEAQSLQYIVQPDACNLTNILKKSETRRQRNKKETEHLIFKNELTETTEFSFS